MAVWSKVWPCAVVNLAGLQKVATDEPAVVVVRCSADFDEAQLYAVNRAGGITVIWPNAPEAALPVLLEPSMNFLSP